MNEKQVLEAAGAAAEMGRRVLATKLATAAVHDGPRKAIARMLRVSLLQDLGELDAALGDTERWVRLNPTGSGWAVRGNGRRRGLPVGRRLVDNPVAALGFGLV